MWAHTMEKYRYKKHAAKNRSEHMIHMMCCHQNGKKSHWMMKKQNILQKKNRDKDSESGLIFILKPAFFSMNFRTYEEAHEFVTLEYKKIAFRIKVKIIDNLCQELSVSLINIACSYYRFLLYAASYRSHQLLSQCLRLTLVCLYDLHKDKIKTCTEV